MKKYFVLLGLLVLVVATICAQPDNLLYELRIYTAEKGKLNELHKRFRQHTLGLFEKHGMTNVAYWTPIDNPDEKLYFALSYPNLAARDAAWAAFQADTVWQRVKKQSEMRGGLVANAQSIYLKTTPYSPKDFKPNCPRVWELRIYTTPPGRLVYLNQRFRDHTMKLFKKHGMRNIIYWAPTIVLSPSQGDLLYYIGYMAPYMHAGHNCHRSSVCLVPCLYYLGVLFWLWALLAVICFQDRSICSEANWKRRCRQQPGDSLWAISCVRSHYFYYHLHQKRSGQLDRAKFWPKGRYRSIGNKRVVY